MCVVSNHHILKKIGTNDDKMVIEIISNYLNKYFYHKQVYLTIAIMSSNSEQAHFHKDIITKLMLSPKFGDLPFNILDNSIDQKQPKNSNAFNLIFIDGIVALK